MTDRSRRGGGPDAHADRALALQRRHAALAREARAGRTSAGRELGAKDTHIRGWRPLAAPVNLT